MWRIFYNPLAVFGKTTGLYVAVVVVALLTIVATSSGIHLDGALDMHLLDLPRNFIPVESLVSWLSLALVLFVASKVAGGNGGVQAHLTATGLARFPYLVAAIVAGSRFFKGVLQKAISTSDGRMVVVPGELFNVSFAISTLAIVLLVIWSIVMLYHCYKEASRVSNGRLAVSFIIGLIVAEVVSKLLLLPIYRM